MNIDQPKNGYLSAEGQWSKNVGVGRRRWWGAASRWGQTVLFKTEVFLCVWMTMEEGFQPQ